MRPFFVFAFLVLFFISCDNTEQEKSPASPKEDSLLVDDYLFVDKGVHSPQKIPLVPSIGFDSTRFIQLLDSFVPTICKLKKPYTCTFDTIDHSYKTGEFHFPTDSLAMAHQQKSVLYRFKGSDFYQNVYIEAYHHPDPVFADHLFGLLRESKNLSWFHPNVNNYAIRTPKNIFWISAAFYFPEHHFRKIVGLFRKCMTDRKIIEERE